jgi:hypothetical protein
MSKNFAVIKDDQVVNLIVSDSKETAEKVTEENCVEYTEGNLVEIGWAYDGVGFISPQPYPSWTLDSQYNWQPPVAQPTVEENSDVYYEWDEPTTSWKAIPITKE